MKYAIIVSRFNSGITERLLEGAKACLSVQGVPDIALTVVHVPGAFEIPLAAQKMAHSKNYSAVICLGAVIRGETPHFEYVCRAAADGVSQVALKTGVPVIFGVLTTATYAQADARAQVPANGKSWTALFDQKKRGKKAAGNKGWEAALAAVEMAALMKQL